MSKQAELKKAELKKAKSKEAETNQTAAESFHGRKCTVVWFNDFLRYLHGSAAGYDYQQLFKAAG